MKPVSICLAVLVLAACDSDGAPGRDQPPPAGPTGGVTISGSARVGVSVTRGAHVMVTGLDATHGQAKEVRGSDR